MAVGAATIDRRFSRTPTVAPAAASVGVAMLAFRWLVIACQAATIWITWPLWVQRDAPPMLPLLGLPAFDVGLPLLATLAVTFLAPLLGIASHTLLLVYAILVDQTRLQPEIVSLAFLLWGTLPDLTARGFARAHLISMWLFAGLNKFLSPDFLNGTAQWMLSGLPIDPSPWLRVNVGYLIAGSELGIGVLALFPRTRLLAALLAFAVHMTILYDLSPLGHDWNPSVWPWNLALAFAGFALIAPWKESVLESLRRCSRWARPLIVLLALAPIGFYFGVVDAYLAHNLYSSNIAQASVTCRGTCPLNVDPSVTWEELNVPLPPEHRVFAQFFALTCRAGDEMVISDSRWWYRQQGLATQRLDCPVEG
jgi:hypothetical protein